MPRFKTFALPLMLAVPFGLAACAPTEGNRSASASPDTRAALAAAVAAPNRPVANLARDRYRHPAETLAFFGVESDDTVVELYPGGGWYTEILAPYLNAGGGTLYVAAPWERGLNSVRTLAGKDAANYSRLAYSEFPNTSGNNRVPNGSADVVLTFRNVHNWHMAGPGKAQEAFNQAYAMLKPGGTLGVVEHRLPEDMSTSMQDKSGYMKRSTVLELARAAGFQMVGESEINANPRDTHDYPKGVWTLPPNYAEKDVDRDKYQAIGESDRMTIRFRKPG